MSTITISIAEARRLAVAAFEAAGATPENARAAARALVAAEIDGQRGHGLTRVPSYAAQLASGKANPAAEPSLVRAGRAAIRVDADHGLAYRAIDLAIDALAPCARENGIAVAAIFRSHHFGQAGAHAEKLAERGLVALVFGNSPKAIALWGSAAPALGTNPIAFAAPMPSGTPPGAPPEAPPRAQQEPPLVIDLALSVAARGKIVAAQKAGTPIPEGWALDADGAPTTDPAEALKVAMAPAGGAKVAVLALMVEIIVATLAGSHFGFEASSLFEAEGPPPDLGHVMIALDPEAVSGGAFAARMAVLARLVEATEGARLPGAGRRAKRLAAEKNGLSIPESLFREIDNLVSQSD